ncbi:putative ABC transporter ATP-binding protein YlmA [Mariniblastus fucicola]|uniref:Putative ABC transporter ATP-binding protein YlmA n=2 Tax=Mariniblastus fucicola TaxID=980251 RepID=A0A5B9P9J1_9BACT|nr:putative ABC transporter ATP-binding protein YlmA [Mariniblastus fucicola]
MRYGGSNVGFAAITLPVVFGWGGENVSRLLNSLTPPFHDASGQHNVGMDLIKIQNAIAWRGSTKVFDGLNLSIPSNCSTAVLGPNGAGKSTLMRIITKKIYPNPTPGCVVEIFGKSRWNVWELRKQLGIVSQDLQHSYRDDVNGFDVVASGFYSTVGIPDHLHVDEQQKDRVDSLLNELQIDSLRDKRYAAMSTGEQRRFLMARALVHDPQTLVFDEPTSGLDIPGIFHYLKTARRLMQSGKTLVVVTHHVHEIPPEVSHLVLMKNGDVMQAGPKADLLCDETISELFDVPLKVVETDGYFQVLPA